MLSSWQQKVDQNMLTLADMIARLESEVRVLRQQINETKEAPASFTVDGLITVEQARALIASEEEDTVKPETKIANDIIEFVKSLRSPDGVPGDAWKVVGSAVQRAGEPDIDAAVPLDDGSWLHMKIEVKTPTGRPSALQLHRLEEYARRGYAAFIATSVSDVREVVRRRNEMGYL